MKEIIKKALEDSISYNEYQLIHQSLVDQEKTTGLNQDEMLVKYTKLNLSRAKRVEKKTVLLEETKQALLSLKTKETWLVISEPWCGDACQTVPVFHALSQQNSLINYRMVFRDEQPELMSNFLTNGGSAIPIIIFIDTASGRVKGAWGPRPKAAQQKVEEYKSLEVKPPYQELAESMQKWYNSNKTIDTQKELIDTWLTSARE